MKVEKIEIGETGLFSPLFLDFLNRKKTLDPFYSNFPELRNFKLQIQQKTRQFSTESRTVLVSSLRKQYTGYELSEKTEDNIESLHRPETFTVTTGHQLNIFTGPLYFIYKIVTVINSCKELKKEFPKNHFVPVYWMASEDHDYEEISYINLDGQKFMWETDQKGAVGRFDPSSLKSVLEKMPGSNEIFKKAYLEHNNLSDSVRYYTNELFGHEGLVILDGDDPQLKSEFKEVMIEELMDQVSFQMVTRDSEALERLGYGTQVTSREINLFYLEDKIRERIVREGSVYKVLNTDLEFREKELLDVLQKEPQKFSPNVILRPLYQEVVLPNLAYVGGPAEVVYWLQLKSTFDHFKIPFPVLLPRNFVLFLNHIALRSMKKTGIKLNELFEPLDDLIKRLVKDSTQNELSLKKEKEEARKIYDSIRDKASAVDSTLNQFVKAENQKIQNSIEKIEKKIEKAEKRHHEDRSRQLEVLKEMLFPQGGPQERSLNYLNFQLEDPEFIDKVLASLSPFDLRYHIIIDERK